MFPRFWGYDITPAKLFFKNGGLLTYSSVSRIFEFGFGTRVRSLPDALRLATPKKRLPEAGGGFLTRKKERVDFSGSIVRLDLSPAAGQIKVSPQYCRIAHHLARLRIHFFCRPHIRLRSSVNPAATIVGGNWGEIGVSAALGDIPRSD